MPSSKKVKKEKKERNNKNYSQRKIEIDHIKKMLNQLGLGEGNPDVLSFYQEMNRFLNTGEAWTGKIPLHGHKRVIKAILTNRSNITCSINIGYDASI
jgi:hypothetical protein